MACRRAGRDDAELNEVFRTRSPRAEFFRYRARRERIYLAPLQRVISLRAQRLAGAGCSVNRPNFPITAAARRRIPRQGTESP